MMENDKEKAQYNGISEAQKRDKMFLLLCEILKVEKIEDKHLIVELEKLHKDYSYETIMETIKHYRSSIYHNYSKGWSYIGAIIINQTPIVYNYLLRKQNKVENEQGDMIT